MKRNKILNKISALVLVPMTRISGIYENGRYGDKKVSSGNNKAQIASQYGGRYISISTGERFDIEQGHSTGYQARI